ncbi:MAG: hypothetical protein IBX69_18110, partial [Anaerolineales bacterium]|nr:hypothetical protein [Anaerolineales bacterium]
MRCGWDEGNWRSLRELELVEEALKDIAPNPPGVMSYDQFHNKFKRVAFRRWNNDKILAFAPPGLLAYVMGDIVLTNTVFGESEDWTKYTIVHEMGHVWDYRTGHRLSRGLM